MRMCRRAGQDGTRSFATYKRLRERRCILASTLPTHMKLRVAIVLALGIVACAPRGDDDASPPAQSKADTSVPPPAEVSSSAFNALRWLEGRWLGSGETQSPFYEAYEFIDDSTAVRRSYGDSTFRQVTDSSVIQLRAGKLESVSETRHYVAVAIAPDSVHFAAGAGAGNSFTWKRRSPTEWTAELTPLAGSGRAPVTYQMRKVP